MNKLLLLIIVITGSNQSPFSIYNVITGSNQSPFFDLQCYYRVKSVSIFDLQGFYKVKLVFLFRFTMLLQGQIGHYFSIYKVVTGWTQSPFFNFQCFYSVKWFLLFSIYRDFT